MFAVYVVINSNIFCPHKHRVSINVCTHIYSKVYKSKVRLAMQIHSLMVFLLAWRAEAFSPVRIASKSFPFALKASDKPLTELCEITKEACDAVSPMLNGESMCT